MNPVAEILFDYLRDALADPRGAELDLERLPEDFRELGKGLQYLSECVAQTRELASALAKGNLRVKLPPSRNEMVAPLKTLYAFLRHIAWQTRQVADGDYTQRLDFMGDFADAFNSMIERLDRQRADLLEAKAKAEADSKSKSSFLATMSHEMRTPLNAILGLSEIQLQKPLSADFLEYVEKIYRSASSLHAIIDDTLDISKIESGNLELFPVDYDLASLVNDTARLNLVLLGSKPVTFGISIDETTPARLRGDEPRIKQILNNILSNAFKYTEKGKIQFDISWKPDNGNAKIIFSVTDTGIGIKQEDIGKLFTEYCKLNSTASRNIEGTGLGLSITKRLVDLMGGTVTVESEYLSGSKFSVEIAQQIVHDVPVGLQVAESFKNLHFFDNLVQRGANLVRSPMPYGRALIVDDVPTNLEVARGLLLPYGLSITCAKSGAEAIELIRAAGQRPERERYDVVFMDHMMPEMDGIEATRVIREDIGTDYAATVPIVALTANAVSGNQEMFLAAGFNGFIPKPIDVSRLDAVLNKFVRDKPRPAAPGPRRESSAPERPRIPGRPASAGLLRVPGLDVAEGARRYGDLGTYLRIASTFAASTPDLLDKLRSPSADKLHDYAVTAHGLKGACLGIGANPLSERAARLERLAKDGDFAALSLESDSLAREAETLLADLRAFLREAGETPSRPLRRGRLPAPDPALLRQMLDASISSNVPEMESILTELERYDYIFGDEIVKWLRGRLDKQEYKDITRRLKTDFHW